MMLGHAEVQCALQRHDSNSAAARSQWMDASDYRTFLYPRHVLLCCLLRAGWNIVVCSVIGVGTLVLWTTWASMTSHPSVTKVWICSLGAAGAMLLEIFDFPPLLGVLDAHSLWHAATVPLTLIWWGFIADDARFRTRALAAKTRRAKAPAMKKTD